MTLCMAFCWTFWDTCFFIEWREQGLVWLSAFREGVSTTWHAQGGHSVMELLPVWLPELVSASLLSRSLCRPCSLLFWDLWCLEPTCARPTIPSSSWTPDLHHAVGLSHSSSLLITSAPGDSWSGDIYSLVLLWGGFTPWIKGSAHFWTSRTLSFQLANGLEKPDLPMSRWFVLFRCRVRSPFLVTLLILYDRI